METSPKGSPNPSSSVVPGPFSRLFDDGVLYAQTTDGQLVDFLDRRPLWGTDAIRGTTSMSGNDIIHFREEQSCDSWFSGAPTRWECALVGTQAWCVGTPPEDIVGITPDPCVDRCGRKYGCISWTPIPNTGPLVQVHDNCGVTTSGERICWRASSVPTGTTDPRSGVRASHKITKLVGPYAIFEDGSMYDIPAGRTVPIDDVVDACGNLGFDRTCALTKDGTVFCWSIMGDGVVGDGTLGDHPFPTAIDDGYSSIACDIQMACGVRVDGKVRCWGLEVGLAPVQIPKLNGVVQVAILDFRRLLALRLDGSLVVVDALKGL